MATFIGIDIGASFIKGALLDLEKRTIRQIIKYPSPKPTHSTHHNKTRFETNCDLYEALVRKMIHEVSKNEIIDGIVFSTQMHGMILVDENLEQLTPFIGWQDERLYEPFDQQHTWMDILQNKLQHTDITKTGINLRSGLMGTTLFWLQEKGVLKKHKDAKAMFLGDYIASKLTRGKPLVHPTNACGSGVFDVEKNCWDINILQTLGIDKNVLPDVVETGEVVGFFDLNGKKVPVFVSLGDLQTAIMGNLIGLGKDREICINIGTGSQVSFLSSSFQRGKYDIRSYMDGMFLNTITFIPAGRALNVIIHFVEDLAQKLFDTTRDDLWEKLTRLVQTKTTSEGLVADISYFKNGISKHVHGSFSHINENNWTIENMFFSALDAMAANYLIAYRRLGKSKKTDSIILSGGLIRKIKPLQDLLEKTFQKNMTLAPFTQETLAGLYIYSLVCSGRFTTIKQASEYIKKQGLKFSEQGDL